MSEKKLSAVDQQLFDAVDKGDLAAVQAAVVAGANVDAEGETGMTPLSEAANDGNLEIVEFLVEKGANINKKAQLTALMEAVCGEHGKVIQYFLDKGATISSGDLSIAQLRVNVREEGMENGMLLPGAADNPKAILDALVAAYQKQEKK
ncbi:MAG: ankyrin repeat domain-containing protein [bacterium]|nr:ankyrin repeat domain-containing protein [bacterium]